MADVPPAEQKGSPWAREIGSEFGAELVRRWNCHDALLAALTKMVKTQAAYIEELPGERGMSTLEMARTAIAKAQP